MGTQLLPGMDSGSTGTPRTGMLCRHPLAALAGPPVRSCNRAEELGFNNAHRALLGNKGSRQKAKFKKKSEK